MRYLLIGLFCAVLALGCGSNSPAPAPAGAQPTGAKGDPTTAAGKQSGKPRVAPPPRPNVGPPP
jgi:hypothetical protein